MMVYSLKRLLLIIPTLLGILLLNFILVQAAPGGPVEQTLAKLRGQAPNATDRFTAKGEIQATAMTTSTTRIPGALGVDPELIADLNRLYGFDKPATERFWLMLRNYLSFDLGQSYFQDRAVLDLILEKLPVSISLGLWTTLLVYGLSIPLGIRKAVADGSAFDVWSSVLIIIGYAIPGFMVAILLVVLFAGGSFWSWFPLRGLVSDNWHDLTFWQQGIDYLQHLVLPITAMMIGGFATLTMLTKNSFLEEIHKQYVLTARAKGLPERRVLFGHVFRNAMLLVISGFPAAFVGILLTGSLLIEVIFSLDGLGLLAYESTLNRDYAVMFGSLYIFSLLGLILNVVSDLTYILIDPRIDFASRGQL